MGVACSGEVEHAAQGEEDKEAVKSKTTPSTVEKKPVELLG